MLENPQIWLAPSNFFTQQTDSKSPCFRPIKVYYFANFNAAVWLADLLLYYHSWESRDWRSSHSGKVFSSSRGRFRDIAEDMNFQEN